MRLKSSWVLPTKPQQIQSKLLWTLLLTSTTQSTTICTYSHYIRTHDVGQGKSATKIFFKLSCQHFAWKNSIEWWVWRWRQRRRRWWWNKCIMSLCSSYVWLNYQLQCTLTTPPSAQPEPGKKHSWLVIIYKYWVCVFGWVRNKKWKRCYQQWNSYADHFLASD